MLSLVMVQLSNSAVHLKSWKGCFAKISYSMEARKVSVAVSAPVLWPHGHEVAAEATQHALPVCAPYTLPRGGCWTSQMRIGHGV
jgi:hypothetical protein